MESFWANKVTFCEKVHLLNIPNNIAQVSYFEEVHNFTMELIKVA